MRKGRQLRDIMCETCERQIAEGVTNIFETTECIYTSRLTSLDWSEYDFVSFSPGAFINAVATMVASEAPVSIQCHSESRCCHIAAHGHVHSASGSDGRAGRSSLAMDRFCSKIEI